MTTGAGGAPTIPAAGFADPTRDAQLAFRAVLDALSHPTRAYVLIGPAEPPAALGRGLGAVALTLLDEECTVWLGRPVDDAEVVAWLTFHTGVRIVADPADADFLLTDPASLPPLRELRTGTEEAPHRSATVVLDISGPAGAAPFLARGPGIDGRTGFEAPWATPGFLADWDHNGALFPRGVDLLLVGPDTVTALPRTTRITRVDCPPHPTADPTLEV